MFEAYDNIIGFSSVDCECLETDRPADYNQSESGLFLGNLAPLEGLIAANSCSKPFWTLLTEARKSAISRMVAESNALLSQKFTPKRRPAYSQVIGQVKAKDTISSDKNYAVYRIACCPVKGGSMRIKELGGVFEGVGNVDVELHNNVDGLLETFTLATTANTFSKVSVNKEYPLYSKYVPVLEYYLVFLFQVGNMPKDTKIDCGCSSSWKPAFNLDKLQFYTKDSTSFPAWSRYISVGGAEVNSISELEDLPAVSSDRTKGLSVEFDFFCNIEQVLCENAIDYKANPLALSLAWAVLYLTAHIAAEALLKTSGFSRENLMNTEDWQDSSDEWLEKYNQTVNYLVENADISANDCLKCKDLLGMTRQGLFS